MYRYPMDVVYILQPAREFQVTCHKFIKFLTLENIQERNSQNLTKKKKQRKSIFC